MTKHDARVVRDEFLVFGSPLIGEAEIAEVADSMRSGWIGTGPKVARFERMLEEYVGVPHVRALGSCTAALMLALRVLDVREGDEVIVPAMTFVATVNAVEHAGARPVFVDSDPRTGLMNLDATEVAINERTRAIMPVHLFGLPLDMDRLNSLRDQHGVAIVEDAAHALGSEWRGRRIGNHGNLTAYSFYVTKNITTIEGGALATEDPAVNERVERLALHGLSAGAWQRFADRGHKHYEVVEPGFKFNMTDVQAALGIHQLPMLDEWIDRRAELWETYDAEFADLPLKLPASGMNQNLRNARHLYAIEVLPEAPVGRDDLLTALHESRIGAGVHYRAVHLHPYYQAKYGIAPESLPVATAISNRTLSLPLSPKITDDDLGDVVTAVRATLSPS
jgi:dTDP-4-amino-4,6-dideoxygalactose transaminase